MHATPSQLVIKRAFFAAAATLILSASFQSVAQSRDKEREAAIVIFLQSVSARSIARMCIRGLPAYQQRFDPLYSEWFEKYRDLVAIGEAYFRDELEKKDQPKQLRERLEQIEKAITELSTDQIHSAPLVFDDRLRAVCGQNLTDLK